MGAQEVGVLVPEPLEPKHVLVLGDEEFACTDNLPVGTLIRYANNDLMSMHMLLVKMVDPDEHERMWDAFEALDEDEIGESIKTLMESYSDRPTERRSSSRGSSKSTKRK